MNKSELKQLIDNILFELNYDKNDEELRKYLYEKGYKAKKIINEKNLSLLEIKEFIHKHIYELINEYQRLNEAIKKKSEENSSLGTSINYQLIDLFNIASNCMDNDEFINRRNEYLNELENKYIFPGIDEVTLEEIKRIYINIIENCTTVTPEAEAKMNITIRENVSLFNLDNSINLNIFNFNYLDKIVDFAKNNGLKVRLHTLIWHKHFPSILNNFSRNEILFFLDKYFETIALRYGEEVFSNIDVLNEICSDEGDDVLRDSKWKNKLGDKYYIDILKLARKHFPNSKLVYNEYGEQKKEKRGKIINIIDSIINEEVLTGEILLDCVGLQSHYNINLSDKEIKDIYKELSLTGKELQVSELDINYNKKAAEDLHSNLELKLNLNRIARTVLDCVSTYNVNSFTFWGPSSKISWKNRKNETQNNGVITLLNSSGEIEPFMTHIVSTYGNKNKKLFLNNMYHENKHNTNIIK